MIGIDKQTEWYLQKAEQLKNVRRKMNPIYDIQCNMEEEINKSIERALMFEIENTCARMIGFNNYITNNTA